MTEIVGPCSVLKAEAVDEQGHAGGLAKGQNQRREGRVRVSESVSFGVRASLLAILVARTGEDYLYLILVGLTGRHISKFLVDVRLHLAVDMDLGRPRHRFYS